MLTSFIGALLQPHDQPAHFTRYRLFRACGASRRQAARWPLPPELPDSFAAAAHAWFTLHHQNAGAIDAYFNNFTPAWKRYLAHGKLQDAIGVWRVAVAPVRTWETRHRVLLHKGTVYYFTAMTWILAGDIDAGYLYTHKALGEDIRTHGRRHPQTPSRAFVVMESAEPNQAFRDWIVEKAAYVEECLARYRPKNGSLTLADLEQRFLHDVDLREEAFLFSHTIARLVRLEALEAFSAESEFAAQLAATLISSLTLLSESLLRRAYQRRVPGKKPRLFAGLLEFLSNSLGLGLTKDRLVDLNKMFRADFGATLSDLLDATLVLT